MRRYAAGCLLEDKQDSDATYHRKDAAVEPPIQPVQALQIPHQLVRAGLCAVEPHGGVAFADPQCKGDLLYRHILKIKARHCLEIFREAAHRLD
ncbi:MAG: hypothetical protein M3Z23_13715 [Acidobacteriota bacterium]|nr:hypothetical protein [Acidobacteriota bacterium]